MKPVDLKLSRLKKTKWHEALLRFLFGGAVTAVAGLIAHQYGPVIGGLFLAFPAILPASATLIERHKGVRAAGVEAIGAVAGSLGMVGFGALVWGMATRSPAWVVLLTASLVWLALSAGFWWLYQWLKDRRRALHMPRREPARKTARATEAKP